MQNPDVGKAISVFGDDGKKKVLLYLDDEKASFDVEISKATGLSPQDLNNKIGELQKEKLIEQMPLSNGIFYTLTSSGRELVGAFKSLKLP